MATQAGEFPKAKILWLLGDACSLRIESSNLNEPLGPFSKQSGQSFSLADFDDLDIELFDAFLPELDDVFLRARIADILWLRRRPRKIHDALTAIDAYRSTALNCQAWFMQDTKDCWHRAITLALQIRTPAEALLAEMTMSLLSAINFELNDGDAAHSMVETLLEYGLAEEQLGNLAERLILRSQRFLSSEEGNRFFLARHYLSLAKRCLGLDEEPERCADVDCLIAQAFADEAAARIAGEHRSYVVAASFYADAVQALLAIPKSLRAARGVDEKLKVLRQTQREVAMHSTGDFLPMRGKAVDVEDIRRSVREEVSGKDLLEALLALAESWPLASRRRTEETTRQRMKEFFFSRLFASEKLSSDGRVIARSPASGDFTQESEASSEAVWNKMVQDHGVHIHYGVQSSIVPALRQVLLEHFINGEDLVNIVAQSGMIPAERVPLVARGLKAGFDGDFIVALHLLVPQLEHLVRMHLQNKGAKTITTDAEGLQMEAGLSSLVKLPEMEAVFGPDLAFEIRALFCDGFGPNLRNELAHGLLAPGALLSAESIYAWWLIFSTIYQQYWYRDTAKTATGKGK
ncbi:hypothetical protein ABIC46_004702 [Variovorax paradoxus]